MKSQTTKKYLLIVKLVDCIESEKMNAYLIIVCGLLIHMMVLRSDIAIYHTSPLVATLYLLSQAMAYRLYPLLGWLADCLRTSPDTGLYCSPSLLWSRRHYPHGNNSILLIYSNRIQLVILVGVIMAIGLIGMHGLI